MSLLKRLRINRDNNPYKWQGDPVVVIFGTSKIETNYIKPLMWYNFECSKTGEATIPSLMVIYQGRKFVIANHHGIGISKLRAGGYPNHPHFSLPIENFTKQVPDLTMLNFDRKEYYAHESRREQWYKTLKS